MSVLYVGCEDDLAELHRRFQAQGDAIAGIKLVSLIGHDTALHPPFRFGTIAEDAADTPFYQFLEHHLAAMGDGDKMLFLDNLGQMYFGDYQDRGQIAIFQNRYVRRLLLAHKATGCILAHPSAAQSQSGEGGAGSPAWSANVRSHLYFDWVRDGKNGEAGRPVDDTRIFSRKKANYSRVHAPGEGVFLTRGDDWTFRLVEKPKPPETARAKRQRENAADETATVFIVRAGLEEFLAEPGRQGQPWSDNAIAPLLTHYLAQKGNTLKTDTVRKYLAKLREGGSPFYDTNYRGAGKGNWICK